MPRSTKTSETAPAPAAPARRRGRPPKSAIAAIAPADLPVTRHFVGYILNNQEGVFSLSCEYEKHQGKERTQEIVDTHIRIPESVIDRLTQEDVATSFVGYAQRMRTELSHRDNYKLHLQKDAPDHVYFSYSIDGAPTTHFFIHPSRVDVSSQAFEDQGEQESFLNAVAHQNFSNKAYKKWREHVREQFLEDVISYELVKKFGTTAERKEGESSQKVAMHGHNGVKKLAAPVAVVQTPVVAQVVERASVEEELSAEEPEQEPVEEIAPVPKPEEPEEEIIPEPAPKPIEAPTIPSVHIGGGEGVIAPKQEESVPSRTPVIARPRILVSTRPSRPMITNVAAPVQLPEYLEARKAYTSAVHALKPFEGLMGAFKKEFQHSEYVKAMKAFTSAKEQFEHARRDYVVFVLTRHLAATLGAAKLSIEVERRFFSLSSWVLQGQQQFATIRWGYLVSEDRYEAYEDVLRRADKNLDMQLELRGLLNTVTLEGYTIASFLGAVLTVGVDKDPAQTVRIASACSADLAYLRGRLKEGFGIEACRVPEMTFSQRRSLDEMVDLSHMRDVLTMLEFHARLRGEVLSMEQHHTTYCDLYTQLFEKYYRVVTHPEGTISVADSLGDEKASIALLESLLRQGRTLKEYAAAKPEGMKFLQTVSKQNGPQRMHELARVFALSRWQGTKMGSRAQELWDHWHDTGAIGRIGIDYLELGPMETLLGALRRAVWAHPDTFASIAGEGDEKAYALLKQAYGQYGFNAVPADPREWLRLGNEGDRVYFDGQAQVWYANTSGKEAGFLEMDEFDGFLSGTPEYVLWRIVHDEGEDVFMDYIKDFPEVFSNYYERKIDVLSDAGRKELRNRLAGLHAQDHDSLEEAESYFRAFYQKHHSDAVDR